MRGTDSSLRNKSERIASDVRGGIAITLAVFLPVLLAIVGVAADYAYMVMIRTNLQKAADAAAIAGAREIPLSKDSVARVKSAALSYAAHALTGDAARDNAQLASLSYSVAADVVDNSTAVKVDITEEWTPFFAHFVMSGVTPVTVSATARFVGGSNICVLGLSPDGNGVNVDRDGRLTGNNCGVFANSEDAAGNRFDSGSIVKASIICSAGGNAVQSSAIIEPTPLSDCPKVDDPLASRQPPSVGACVETGLRLKDVTKTISPGVYCGGLLIDGNSKISLEPGIYILKNGGLTVSGQAQLIGSGVSFFLTGSSPGKVLFTMQTHISVSAPEDGPTAGLLIFEDPAIGARLKHRITSDDARVLLGTIYLPVGDLVIDAKKPVVDQSAYTAIIAQHIELNSGPNLILNSNYDATNVPVPEGIRGTRQVVLSK
jgi:Flp pilus assembly protein TadG